MCVLREGGEGEAGQAVKVLLPCTKSPLGPPPPLQLKEPPPHLEVTQDQSQNLLINPVIRGLSKISVALDG